MNRSMPLSNYLVTRTRSIDEMRNALAQVYAKPTLEPAGTAREINAIVNHCGLDDISLDYCTYGASVHVEFPCVRRFLYLTQFRGKGTITSGREATPLVAGCVALISPSTGYRADYDEDCERLIIQFDARSLIDKLAALIGRPVDDPLRMELHGDFSGPGAKALRDYLPILANTLSSLNSPLPKWWVAQTEVAPEFRTG